MVKRVRQLQRGQALPRWAPGLWKALALQCFLHIIAWVPSHGKNPDWEPDFDSHSALTWRSLNDLADVKAQEVAGRQLRVLRPWVETLQSAVDWTAIALDRQRTGLKHMHDLISNAASA